MAIQFFKCFSEYFNKVTISKIGKPLFASRKVAVVAADTRFSMAVPVHAFTDVRTLKQMSL